MGHHPPDAAATALLICDLQNDFIHPDGAYARGGLYSEAFAALPGRLKPLAEAVRAGGGITVGTRFTLLPDRNGEPLISAHLKAARPFLRAGDFAPASWGAATVAPLQPLTAEVEKVAFSAFHMSRLEWVLRRFGISHLLVCGILTSGGVASTARDAHVREFHVTVLEDGCGDFTEHEHAHSIASLRKVATITSIEAALADWTSSFGAVG